MRKMITFIFLVVALFLVACNKDTNIPVTENELTEQEANENDVFDNDEQSPEVEGTAPTDLADLLGEMASATNDIQSVTSESFNIRTSKVKEDTFVTESEITSQTIIDPYTQHVDHTVISGEGEDSELYFNEEAMYVFFAEDGWFNSANLLGDIAVGNAIKARQINYFIENVDFFELKDEGEYFLITYIGADEKLADVFSSIEMTPITINGLLYEDNNTVPSTGTIEIKVSKETLFITEFHSIAHSTLTETNDMEVTEDVTTTYTYNNVDDLTIPQDVIDQAKVLEIPSVN